MKEVLLMSDLTNLPDLRNAISLLELEFGRLRYETQDGVTIDASGRQVAHASLSAKQAKVLGLLTSGTYGPTSTISSKSAILQRSLESRLRQRTQSLGSTLWKLTWKPWVTDSQRLRFRLRASAVPTSATVLTGWPTPTLDSASERKVRYSQGGLPLTVAAQFTGWATPSARDWHSASGSPEFLASRLAQSREKPLSEQVFTLAGWATPDTTMMQAKAKPPVLGNRKPTDPQISLADQASHLTGPARLTAFGEMLTGSDAQMESGGQLNPEHPRWLMGIPSVWASCVPTAMQLTQNKRASLLKARACLTTLTSCEAAVNRSTKIILKLLSQFDEL